MHRFGSLAQFISSNSYKNIDYGFIEIGSFTIPNHLKKMGKAPPYFLSNLKITSTSGDHFSPALQGNYI